MRVEVRNFLSDPMLRTIVAQAVDVENPKAHYPIGTTITCDAGHEICELRESIELWQEITPYAFGEMRGGQARHTFNQGTRRLDCNCGRPFFANGKLHTKRGWGNRKQPWAKPVVAEQPRPIVNWLDNIRAWFRG